MCCREKRREQNKWAGQTTKSHQDNPGALTADSWQQMPSSPPLNYGNIIPVLTTSNLGSRISTVRTRTFLLMEWYLSTSSARCVCLGVSLTKCLRTFGLKFDKFDHFRVTDINRRKRDRTLTRRWVGTVQLRAFTVVESTVLKNVIYNEWPLTIFCNDAAGQFVYLLNEAVAGGLSRVQQGWGGGEEGMCRFLSLLSSFLGSICVHENWVDRSFG